VTWKCDIAPAGVITSFVISPFLFSPAFCYLLELQRILPAVSSPYAELRLLSEGAVPLMKPYF